MLNKIRAKSSFEHKRKDVERSGFIPFKSQKDLHLIEQFNWDVCGETSFSSCFIVSLQNIQDDSIIPEEPQDLQDPEDILESKTIVKASRLSPKKAESGSEKVQIDGSELGPLVRKRRCLDLNREILEIESQKREKQENDLDEQYNVIATLRGEIETLLSEKSQLIEENEKLLRMTNEQEKNLHLQKHHNREPEKGSRSPSKAGQG